MLCEQINFFSLIFKKRSIILYTNKPVLDTKKGFKSNNLLRRIIDLFSLFQSKNDILQRYVKLKAFSSVFDVKPIF